MAIGKHVFVHDEAKENTMMDRKKEKKKNKRFQGVDDARVETHEISPSFCHHRVMVNFFPTESCNVSPLKNCI